MVAFIRLAGATIWMAHVRPCTGTTCLACCCDRKNVAPFHGTQDADPNLSDAGIHPSSRKVPVPHYADHAHFQICLCKSLPCLCCDQFSRFYIYTANACARCDFRLCVVFGVFLYSDAVGTVPHIRSKAANTIFGSGEFP